MGQETHYQTNRAWRHRQELKLNVVMNRFTFKNPFYEVMYKTINILAILLTVQHSLADK